jgi:hypothetical protein
MPARTRAALPLLLALFALPAHADLATRMDMHCMRGGEGAPCGSGGARCTLVTCRKENHADEWGPDIEYDCYRCLTLEEAASSKLVSSMPWALGLLGAGTLASFFWYQRRRAPKPGSEPQPPAA